MRNFSQKTFLLFLCVLLYLASTFSITYIGKSPVQFISIGSYSIHIFSVQGIFSALQTLSYILMVFISYKEGFVLALAASGFSLIKSLLPIIRYHTLTSLPGTVSVLISIFTLILIYSYYKKAAVNSITDYTTGLHNRRSYVKEMNDRLKVNKPFCLAYIEIEDFKQINNVFGMQTGDHLLRRLAERLRTILNKDDMLFSITAPTFAIVFEGIDNAKDVEDRLRPIVKPQMLPVIMLDEEGQEAKKACTITLAAGIVHINSPVAMKQNATSVLKAAETAMLEARRASDSKICIFNETMESAEAKQKEAEFLIKESLEKDYFYLVYQPQFTTGKKQLRGFETLIRCKKPDGTIVSPAYFIPAAEKTNLIMKIDDYVLRRAMTEFKPILDAMKKDCILSINVSAKNIGSEHFSAKIKNLLQETQFPPKKLEIEITEYSFAESMETTVKNINDLRTLGVQIALDDFGTGYTSIAQLMKLPVNLLKIDKSLIDDIETSQTMRDMVDSVIYMGHIMNCEVISEGVENENQLAMLREHKCDFIQGFVWGKPQSFSDAEQLCMTEGA